MKIGILGGTFDPPHKVHLKLAIRAKEVLGIDVVYLMPCGTPPHKDGRRAASRFFRYEMCELACEGHEGIETSDFELVLLEPNYSYQTLSRFAAEHPKDEITFLMGQDSLEMFLKWKHPEVIVKNAGIGVFVRDDGSDDEDGLMDRAKRSIEEIKVAIGGDFTLIPVTPSALSSTLIREALSGDKDAKKRLYDVSGIDDIRDALSEGVYDYMIERGIYTDKETMDYSDIEKSIKKTLKKSRYRHTLGVCYTASALAMRYHVNMEDARLAGLLHDCAKGMEDDDLYDFCKKKGLPITDAEKKSPHLLHSKVGAYLAKKEYGVKDEAVLHAITVHTTGCPDMSMLDMIIFVADYIEPNRDRAPRLTEIRHLAFYDIESAALMILEDTMKYVEDRGMYMDPMTKDTYEFYKNKINK